MQSTLVRTQQNLDYLSSSLSLSISLLAGAANLSVRLHVLYRQGGEAAQAQAGG